ncbi:MAG: N-acetylglucosamine-specific PTS transporter subunit IIBC [Sphingomonas bacterium]
MKSILGALQPLGRALMLPIAVLPIAGLLLRLGQPDLHGLPFVGAAGQAIFDHLGLLFAIGVATGFARDGNGAACLAGVTCFLVATEAGQTLLSVPPEAAAGFTGASVDLAVAAWKAKVMARLDVPIGILSGLVGGLFYNRFATTKLPEYLAFFGGRRFVPIVAGLAGLMLAAVVGFGFQTISGGIDAVSVAATSAGAPGLFAFGVLNRLLLVTGLHHVLNNVAWFVVGDWHGTTGDLRRFFAGDPSAGSFMAGFFPVMMFGLPAACLAMYRAAAPDRRKAVGGMLFSLALTSALTGVTEPIEFSFMFLAPLLYVIHALLTGLSMAVMDLLGVKLGFGFSAGLLDYVLNYGKATRPLLLLPVGAVYFLLYYGLFRFFIRRFDLPTPGREPLVNAPAVARPVAAGGRGGAFAQALGGSANLVTVSACTTRLRLVVRDQAAVDDVALKALGARGMIRPSATALQVVLGPIADLVAVEIRDALAMGDIAAAEVAEDAAPLVLSEPLIAALGGAGNIARSSRHHGRLRIALRDGAAADATALGALAGHGIARPAPGLIHVLGDEGALAGLVAG